MGSYSGSDLRSGLLRIRKGTEPSNVCHLASSDNCFAVAKHEISAKVLEITCKMSKRIQQIGRISRVSRVGVMAQVPHQRLVTHRRGAYAISYRSKTPPKAKLQSPVAFDEGSTSGVTRMSFMCFSGHPQKAMRFNHWANNFSSSSESRYDVSKFHSGRRVRVVVYKANLETRAIERFESGRHQFIFRGSINRDVDVSILR